MRHLLRCREEFSGGIVHALLLAGFSVTLVYFGRTLNNLFLTHGTHLNPLYRLAALAMVGIFVLSIIRRVYYKFVELREIRREMNQLQLEMRNTEP